MAKKLGLRLMSDFHAGGRQLNPKPRFVSRSGRSQRSVHCSEGGRVSLPGKGDHREEAMLWDLAKFEPVYGQAQGQHLNAPLPYYALLPFIFSLKAIDATHLRLLATDFHSNTWQAIRTVEQLEELKAEMDIAGSLHDFLVYIRESFSSENVKIVLGGSSSGVGGHGANSARAVAQKTKASAKISLTLTKFGGPSSKDAMGFIVGDLFQAFRSQSLALSAERKRASALAAALVVERENAQSFQEDYDSTTHTCKRRKLSSSQFASTSTLNVQTNTCSEEIPSEERAKEDSHSARHYVRLASSSRRAKPKEPGQLPNDNG